MGKRWPSDEGGHVLQFYSIQEEGRKQERKLGMKAEGKVLNLGARYTSKMEKALGEAGKGGLMEKEKLRRKESRGL